MLFWLFCAILLCGLAFIAMGIAKVQFEVLRLGASGVAFMSTFSVVTDMVNILRHPKAKECSFEETALEVLKACHGRDLPRVCGVVWLGKVILIWTKADCLEDLYLKQNAKVTKAP